MDKNLQLIKDFVEGRVDFESFYKRSMTDMKDLLFQIQEDFADYVKEVDNYPTKKFQNNLLEYLKNTNVNNSKQQYQVMIVFSDILWMLDIDHKNTNYYVEKVWAENIIPNWLPDSAAVWVEKNILNKVPEGLSETQRKKWAKTEVEKIYPCEKKHPSWVQGTEDWPQDEDGNNLTFVKQRERGEQVTYTFVNPKTKETVDVIEFY